MKLEPMSDRQKMATSSSFVVQGDMRHVAGRHAVGIDGNVIEATDGVVVADLGADDRLTAAEVGDDLALLDLLQPVDLFLERHHGPALAQPTVLV